MGSSYTQELALALASSPKDKATLRPHVLRLTHALKERSGKSDKSSSEFVRSAVELLRRLQPSVCPDSCFEGLSFAVPYLYAHGELGTALGGAKHMHALAVALNRKELLRKSENYQGIIHKALGHVPDAVVHYQRSLSLAQETGYVYGEAIVLQNLGSIFAEAGLYREAQACLERAIALPGDDLLSARSSSYFNLAILFSRIGKREMARRAMEQSLATLVEPTTVPEYYSRTLREANYVYLAVEMDAIDEAKRHAELTRTYAQHCASRPTAFFVTLAAGLCACAEGKHAEGISTLKTALHEAKALDQPDLTADSLAALAWAFELAKKPEEALESLRHLIEYIANKRRICLDAIDDDVQLSASPDSASELLWLKYREAKLEAASTKLAAESSRIEMLQRLAMAATLRDDPSGMHGIRVGRLSALLAAKIGWTPDRCYELNLAASLHDIGKSAVPDHILLGSGPLRNAERDFIRSHPQIGASLLTNASDQVSRLAADIALYHHEHWDGGGYPLRLSESRIPLAARMVAIADVFDALTHGRPYATAWTVDDALTEISSMSGTQFDPALIPPFVDLICELKANHDDLDGYLEAHASALPFRDARKKIEAMIRSDRERLETAH